jgi:hypothetical protein
MTLLYQQTNITICHCPDDEWLYVDWTGYQSVEQVKQGCEQMLLYMIAQQTFDVLNDNTNVSGIWIGAADWVGSDWFPRMRAKGLRRFAWVYSPSRFSQISTNTALAVAPPNVARVFDEKEAAEKWLRTQRETATRLKTFADRSL